MVSSPIECSTGMLLKPMEVAQMMRVSIRTLWRMVAKNELPNPVRLGKRRLRWRHADLVKFIEEL